MKPAAARAATRRGSSTRTFLPPSQSASKQRQRHLRGLARAGRRFQHQPRMPRQRGLDLRQQIGDGEVHGGIVGAPEKPHRWNRRRLSGRVRARHGWRAAARIAAGCGARAANASGRAPIPSCDVADRKIAPCSSSTSAPTSPTTASTTTATRCCSARVMPVSRMIVTGASRNTEGACVGAATSGELFATAGVHPHHAIEYTEGMRCRDARAACASGGGGSGRMRAGLLPRLLAAARATQRRSNASCRSPPRTESRCSCTSATRMPTSWR